MKNAMADTIMGTIVYKGRTPLVLTGVERAFILDYACDYFVSGYVVGLIGSYKSKFKHVNIQTTKAGRKYVVADKVRFWLDTMQEAPVDKAELEKRLAQCEELRADCIKTEAEGQPLGCAVENQEFYIKNIKKYMERSAE